MDRKPLLLKHLAILSRRVVLFWPTEGWSFCFYFWNVECFVSPDSRCQYKGGTKLVEANWCERWPQATCRPRAGCQKGPLKVALM